MDINVLKKTTEKITLKDPMTIEELYELMMQNSDKMPGKFKFKKGLLGKSIMFDVFMQNQPRITVKDDLVTIRRMGNKTSVGIGDLPSMDFKAIKEGFEAVKDGGISKVVSGGAEYFVSVCDAMLALLSNNIK